ncbi:hypothetical protein [Halarsenatibacter silvermanii]|uniref:Fimbrial assembly protein (PilN) n=1 Tax=Halarsenatibacter silvermanii TaxID=321763 RepID=A0A1G9K0P1_9FIRM|nr:hypothetical protein [Halarsenatibacter silvermanii]SDL42723.1 hypothetical protein SAMN04488692_104127 [Halarsenatibacter silvermanii]
MRFSISNENKINFVNPLLALMMSRKREIVIFLLLAVAVSVFLVFRISRDIKEIRGEKILLQVRREELEVKEAEYRRVLKNYNKPDKHFNLIKSSVNALDRLGSMSNLTYSYPRIKIEGRAHSEEDLQRIIGRAEKARLKGIESTVLRKDYRSQPGFELIFKAGDHIG